MCITPKNELLQQCIASGQVEACQAVQHAEAGEYRSTEKSTEGGSVKMTDSLEDMDGIFGDSETPITNALIQKVMKAHPGVSARAQAEYYEAVHQELAPLAREFEKQITALKAQVAEMTIELQKRWAEARGMK